MNKKSNAFFSLVSAALVFAVLPYIPYGYYLNWPFQMLTTYVHELGHGLAALAQGGNFIRLEIFPSGGGVATTSGAHSGWGRALVAAGGLLAPAFAGALFILAGQSRRSASVIFNGFAILMLLSCAMWIRSAFALTLVGGLGILFLYFGLRAGKGVHQFLVQFFAVHMLVDTMTRTMRYLFTESFEREGQVRHSDTSVIADSLGGPYWLWGIIIALIAMLLFYWSFRRTYLRS